MPSDHPRGCGEHYALFLFKDGEEGSSPRMRGAPILYTFGPVPRRIIPADAGSTSYRIKVVVQGQDHPRGCGEHSIGSLGTCGFRGSSPRMRGARQDNDDCTCR